RLAMTAIRHSLFARFLALRLSRFTRALERFEALAQRLHHGDLLAERPARDFSPPLGLAREDIGNVGESIFGRIAHDLVSRLEGSAIPVRLQNDRQLPLRPYRFRSAQRAEISTASSSRNCAIRIKSCGRPTRNAFAIRCSGPSIRVLTVPSPR